MQTIMAKTTKLTEAPVVVVDGRQLVSDPETKLTGFIVLEFEVTENGIKTTATNSCSDVMVRAGAEALEQQAGGCDSFDPDNFEDFLKNLLGAMEPDEEKNQADD